MSSYTEENKRKAREIMMGGKMGPKVAVPDSIAFPNVLGTPINGQKYSDVFPEYFLPNMTDFALPDIGEIPDWAQAYIPEESDYLGDAAVVYDAVVAWALKSVTRLVGYPGTGKSEGLPVYMAYKLNLPLLRVPLNDKEMTTDTIFGGKGIENDGGTPITRFKDGLLVPWVQIPSIILLDEFCRSTVEVSNGLFSLMEGKGKLLLPAREEGHIVHRNKDCWLLATDNVKGTGDSGVGMVGTDQMDGAALDRFTETIEMDYLPADKAVTLLLRVLPTYPEHMAKMLASFGHRVQTAYKQGRLPVSFSQRSMYAIALKSCVTHNLHTAVKSVFLNRFDSDDKTFVAQLYKDVSGEDL